MIQDELWSLFPPYWDEDPTPLEVLGHVFGLYCSCGPEAYFIFVEEAASVDRAEAIDAPDGGCLDLSHLESAERQIRFRASGVSVRGFLEALRTSFTEELTGRPDDDQRSRRLGQLLRYFEKERVYRFDIYVGGEDPAAPAISATLLPSSWNLVVLRRNRPERPARRVFQSLDDAGPDQPYERKWLRLIGPISPWIELRLRDIFSLNHIRDAELGLGGGGAPPGGPGDDGWRPGAVKPSPKDEKWGPEVEGAGA